MPEIATCWFVKPGEYSFTLTSSDLVEQQMLDRPRAHLMTLGEILILVEPIDIVD